MSDVSGGFCARRDRVFSCISRARDSIQVQSHESRMTPLCLLYGSHCSLDGPIRVLVTRWSIGFYAIQGGSGEGPPGPSQMIQHMLLETRKRHFFV